LNGLVREQKSGKMRGGCSEVSFHGLWKKSVELGESVWLTNRTLFSLPTF
jgi:hypothetical protein